MATTFMTLMKRLAVKAGMNPESTAGAVDWTELDKFALVQFLNEAIDWAWTPGNPRLAWAETVDTDEAIEVVDGVIDWDDLGDGDWFSLWDADPRPSGSRACQYQVRWDVDGVYPLGLASGVSTVFAFFRTVVPAGVYVASPGAGSDYATPVIPDRLVKMVIEHANGLRLLGKDQVERGYAAMRAADGLWELEVLKLMSGEAKMPWGWSGKTAS